MLAVHRLTAGELIRPAGRAARRSRRGGLVFDRLRFLRGLAFNPVASGSREGHGTVLVMKPVPFRFVPGEGLA